MCRQLEIRQPKMCLIHGNFQKSSLFFFCLNAMLPFSEHTVIKHTKWCNVFECQRHCRLSVDVECLHSNNFCWRCISAGWKQLSKKTSSRNDCIKRQFSFQWKRNNIVLRAMISPRWLKLLPGKLSATSFTAVVAPEISPISHHPYPCHCRPISGNGILISSDRYADAKTVQYRNILCVFHAFQCKMNEQNSTQHRQQQKNDNREFLIIRSLFAFSLRWCWCYNCRE